MAHVSDKKKEIVSEFTSLIDEFPVIGAVNMQNMPTKQLQNMRSILRGREVVLKMTKRRLMKIAFKESKKKDINILEPYLEGMPALIFTKGNPFKLATELKKNKSTAPAKPGQVAPKNIVVPAGPTPFTPGPIISQLAKVGIKSGIDGGKIAVKEDAVVAKKGEVISDELAGILLRLGIEPMEIGLSLTAVYEDGVIFTSDLLEVDEKVYVDNLMSAAGNATALALEISYMCTETVPVLISKAAREADVLAMEAHIVTKDNIQNFLIKAETEMRMVSSLVDGPAPAEVPVETPKEEEQPKEKEDVPAAGLSSLF